MMIGVAKLRVDCRHAFEVMTDLGFHGHADAAVNLDRLLADEAAGAADLHFRRRNRLPPLAPVVLAAIMVASIAMLRACSTAISISAARCCNTWKLPMATPNCLRVFIYSTVVSCIAAMAPTASAHSAAIAASVMRSISGKAAPGSPIAAAASTRTLFKRHLGGAQAVHRGVTAHRNAGRGRIDKKQCQAVAFVTRAGEPRRRR